MERLYPGTAPATNTAYPPDHPQRSFVAFLERCLYTIDEARAGEVRPWPTDARNGVDAFGRSWDAYWRDVEDTFLRYTPVLLDKTRRVMATNVVSAFDLWIASGGQDPRWPSLMRSRNNRKVIIQSQKLEDVTGSAAFLARIGDMCRIAEEHGLRDLWPDFPRWKFTFKTAKSDQGGQIIAVQQGANQVRGPGVTLLHMEELSFWEQAQDTVETALPALQPEGHLLGVTTPAAATYAARIRRGDTAK